MAADRPDRVPTAPRRILRISGSVAAGLGVVMAAVTLIVGPTPGAWVGVIGMTITAGYVTAVMLQLHSATVLAGSPRAEPPIRRWTQGQLLIRTGLVTAAGAAMCGVQVWLIAGGSRDTVAAAVLTGLVALTGPVVLVYELRRRNRAGSG